MGEEVGAVAGGGDVRFQARELGAVLGEDFAVAGEVGGFEGAGGGFAVEGARELGEEGGALWGLVLVRGLLVRMAGVGDGLSPGSRAVVLPAVALLRWVRIRCRFWRRIGSRCGRAIPSVFGVSSSLACPAVWKED